MQHDYTDLQTLHEDDFSAGHGALYVDGECSFGFIDRDTSRLPIPDHGKFGFRLIGSDVAADVRNFRVIQLDANPHIFKSYENHTG